MLQPQHKTIILIFFLSHFFTGCYNDKDEALGTLEWDRIHGRAIKSEAISKIYVNEGDFVEYGQPLLKLDDSLQKVLVKKIEASVEKARWKLRQLENGYRIEDIASAKAELQTRTKARKAEENNYLRQKYLRLSKLNSEVQLEEAKLKFDQSLAYEEVALQKLRELKSGYQVEKIEQARASLSAQSADLEYQKLKLERYTIVATRSGKIDHIPYKLGDKPPINSVVTTILAGENPWARIYFPETWLSQLSIGDNINLIADGLDNNLKGRIRFISSVPSFTPYYALNEGDRGRLMYIAEIDILDKNAKKLPVGIPVQAFKHKCNNALSTFSRVNQSR